MEDISQGYRSKFEETPISQTRDNVSIKLTAEINYNLLNEIRTHELRLIIHTYMPNRKGNALPCNSIATNKRTRNNKTGKKFATITVITDSEKNH